MTPLGPMCVLSGWGFYGAFNFDSTTLFPLIWQHRFTLCFIRLIRLRLLVSSCMQIFLRSWPLQKQRFENIPPTNKTTTTMRNTTSSGFYGDAVPINFFQLNRFRLFLRKIYWRMLTSTYGDGAAPLMQVALFMSCIFTCYYNSSHSAICGKGGYCFECQGRIFLWMHSLSAIDLFRGG